MKYMLLLYIDPREHAAGPELEQIIAEHRRLPAASPVRASMSTSNALEPASTATTVGVRNTRTMTTDGPSQRLAEQLGGYYG